MIRLFRSDGLELMLNTDQIKEVRTGAATVVVLLDGQEIEVKNTPSDIMAKVHARRLGQAQEERALDNGQRFRAPAAKSAPPAPGGAGDASGSDHEPQS